jgi:hypothetical protein
MTLLERAAPIVRSLLAALERKRHLKRPEVSYRVGGDGGAPGGGGGGGVAPGGASLGLLGRLVKLPYTGTLWPLAYMHWM